MRRFRFSLEKVLELRAYREREAELELGRAIGILAEIEGRIRDNALERRAAAAERFLPSNDAMAIISWENYIQRLDLEREGLFKEAAQAQMAVDEKREAYLEASRERKVMDRLKEKRETEYRRETLAQETAVLDDISQGARARARSSLPEPSAL
jgi:flagellar FliJ protein